MARLDQNGGQQQVLFDALKEQTDRRAEYFATPRERILVCLARIAEAFRADGSRQDESLRRAVDLFDEAVSTLKEEPGIELLEKIDPLQLQRRIQTVEYLRSESTPFSSLEELRDQLESFLGFQDEIKEFLIKTGLPPKSFDASPWLQLHLGRLYDTRRTGSPYPPRELPPVRQERHVPPDDELGLRDRSNRPAWEPYDWLKYPPGPHLMNEIESCTYEDADILPGLNPDDAALLEKHRPNFFAARQKVVAAVIESCKRSRGEGLLERCLDVLDANLRREEILLMLRADAYYLGGDPREREHVEISPKMSPGGLTNLVEVIGHVEDELTTGRIDRLKRSLPASFVDEVLGDGVASAAYFESTLTPEAVAVDSALDAFFQSAHKSQRHWQGVCHRFTKWLDPDFRISVPAEVRPEFAELVALQLPLIIARLESQIEAGDFPVARTAMKATHRFHYADSSWHFEFHGKSAARPHLDGFFYVAELLKAPEEEVKASELRVRIMAWKEHGSDLRQKKDQVIVARSGGDDDPRGDVEVASPDAGPSSDERAIRECKARLKQVEQEMADAEGAGQVQAIARLREERAHLQQYIDANSSYKKPDEPRRLKDEKKKASDAVRKAIDTAIEHLRKTHPPLCNHLDRYIQRGATCRYAPPTPVHWEF